MAFISSNTQINDTRTMKRLAIIRLSALGDVIISASMLAWLRSLGNYRIEWFVDKRFQGVIEDSPCIDKIHALDIKSHLKSLKGIFYLRDYLKKCGEFDIVVDMQGLLKSAIIGKMLNSKQFVGFGKNGARERLASLFYTTQIDLNYNDNILYRNFEVLFSTLEEYQQNPFSINDALSIRSKGFGSKIIATSQIKQRYKLDSASLRILFVLEASIPEKIYPYQSFVKLAKILHSSLHCSFYLAFKDNVNLANSLYQGLKNEKYEAIKLDSLSFDKLKCIFPHIHCVIGGDTGLSYLAWAMQTPCITLYGNKPQSKGNNKGKNMRNTPIERILLGNPYILSQSDTFEIATIAPEAIFETFQTQIYPHLQKWL